jgi:hypothetical protein
VQISVKVVGRIIKIGMKKGGKCNKKKRKDRGEM